MSTLARGPVINVGSGGLVGGDGRVGGAGRGGGTDVFFLTNDGGDGAGNPGLWERAIETLYDNNYNMYFECMTDIIKI